MPPPQEENKQASANAAVNILQEISEILVSLRFLPPLLCLPNPNQIRVSNLLTQNCHLDRRELSICISLIERGVNPEALAVSSLYSSSLLLTGG